MYHDTKTSSFLLRSALELWVIIKISHSYWDLTILSCLSLHDPNNGMISCSLGNDGMFSYENAYSYTCNTGYEPSGIDTKTVKVIGDGKVVISFVVEVCSGCDQNLKNLPSS